MNAPARVATRLADPVEVLIARSTARAYLYSQGEFDLHEAVDGLQAAAIKLGLIESIGQDAVQDAIAQAFRPVREADEAARNKPRPELEPILLISTDGVPSAEALQRVYERKIAERRAIYGPAISTLRAAQYPVQQGDPGRLRSWLLKHDECTRVGIIKHLRRYR
jgi:hypothetical protein